MTNINHIRSLRLESAPFRLIEFLKSNINVIGERTIGEAFRRVSQGEGMTSRYQQSLRITSDNLVLKLELSYKGDNGEPLGRWFEDGTKGHFIEPKKKKFLSWIQNGTRFFSKGHFVRGIQAKRIIEKTLDQGLPEYKRQIVLESENFLKDSAI